MVEIRVTANLDLTRKHAIEGPSLRQARKMARVRQEWLAQARELVATGRKQDRLIAFQLDCDAWDVEMDLTQFGFDPDTGKKRK